MTRSPRDQLGEYTEELRCSWSWTEWPAGEDEEGFCAESLSSRGCFFCVLEDFVRILQINLNVFPSLDHLSPGQLVNQSWPPSDLGWSLLAAGPGPGR